MRPIRVGKTEYAVEHPVDKKGRPGKALVARDPEGNVVAIGHTRAELRDLIESN